MKSRQLLSAIAEDDSPDGDAWFHGLSPEKAFRMPLILVLSATKGKRKREGGASGDAAEDSLGRPHGLMSTCDESVLSLHTLIWRLPWCDWHTPHTSLPEDGIYWFFEEGEHLKGPEENGQRIVRVGTHRVSGRFRTRIDSIMGPPPT